MTKITNRITYKFIIKAINCNPNGDPLNGNRPRENYDGFGEISDVCLKRKIRNRMMDLGNDIFVKHTMEDNKVVPLIKFAKTIETEDTKDFLETAKSKWLDVRTFGQIFSIPKKEVNMPVTCNVRGAVSLTSATSIDQILIKDINILSTTRFSDDNNQFGLFGFKYVIERGVYVVTGGVYPQLADLNKFTYEDWLVVKECILTMFENDTSISRPYGSMEVCELYIWEDIPNKKHHNISKILRSVDVVPDKEYPYYKIERPYILEDIKEEHIECL